MPGARERRAPDHSPTPRGFGAGETFGAHLFPPFLRSPSTPSPTHPTADPQPPTPGLWLPARGQEPKALSAPNNYPCWYFIKHAWGGGFRILNQECGGWGGGLTQVPRAPGRRRKRQAAAPEKTKAA